MTMMSCFDEAMQNIEQLASRQRTELLSLIELHNQQLNDFIRAAKENLLRIRSEGQHILASKPEIKEKEKKPISVYPISTTIITTSTSTTTQNAPANKKSTGMLILIILLLSISNANLILFKIHKFLIPLLRKRKGGAHRRQPRSKFQPINEKMQFYKQICS